MEVNIKHRSNSRQKRKTAYKALNLTKPTHRMDLEVKGDYLDPVQNHKKHDIEVNAARDSRIKQKFRGFGKLTRKYACGIQHI